MKKIIIIFLFVSCNNEVKEMNTTSNDYSEKANFFYKSFDYYNSKLYFDTLIELNPNSGEFFYKRGYSNYMIGEDLSAIPDFLNSISLNYKNKKGAFLTLGTIYRILQKHDSALYYYDKAIEIDSNYSKAINEKKELLKIIKKLE